MNVRLYANYGWSERRYELRAGVIDSTARHVFVSGQCHSLALALHEETGLPIVGAYASHWGDTPGHVAVQLPDGDILDINGRVDAEDWAERWGRLGEVDPADAYDAFGDDYRKPKVDTARHWVWPLLRRFAPEVLANDGELFTVVAELELSA